MQIIRIGLVVIFFLFLPVAGAADQFLGVACSNKPDRQQRPAKVSIFTRSTRGFKKVRRIKPYGRRYFKGINCALGDVNNDGVKDVIVAPGKNGRAPLKVFDSETGKLISGPAAQFFAFGPNFQGGVFVAAGDVNGDGFDDIVAGAGDTAPQVNVFNGQSGEQITFFNAYEADFTGGVRVATANFDRDELDEIIVSPGPGKLAHIKIFTGATGSERTSFFAFGEFTGGVYVSAGDIDSDGTPDIIVGSDRGTVATVKVFDGIENLEIRSFIAFTPRFRGGVSVASGDFDEDGSVDILVAKTRGNPGVRGVDSDGATLLTLRNPFAPEVKTGANVSGSN